MAVYLISFDLDSPGQNYDKIGEAIKSYDTWAKILTTTFLIVADETAKDVRDYLIKFIDSNDKLFVAKLSGETAWTGPFSKEITEWLKNNIVSANL